MGRLGYGYGYALDLKITSKIRKHIIIISWFCSCLRVDGQLLLSSGRYCSCNLSIMDGSIQN